MGRLHASLEFFSQIGTRAHQRLVFFDNLGLRLCELERHIRIG